jgi:hypothetical protein
MVTDQFEFIYGDDYGEIEAEELGSMNGTTTRQMLIPHRLAVDLHDDLHEELTEATERYVVYGKEGYSIANVCVVEASGEAEAIEKAKDHAGYVGSRPTAKKIEDALERGDVWAAVL